MKTIKKALIPVCVCTLGLLSSQANSFSANSLNPNVLVPCYTPNPTVTIYNGKPYNETKCFTSESERNKKAQEFSNNHGGSAINKCQLHFVRNASASCT